MGLIDGLFVGTGELVGLWLHGGGYVFGSPETHTFAASYMAHKLGGRIFIPAYRLAPEHIWPAALDDIQQLLETVPAPLILMGDSAGGHLAIQTALKQPEKISKLILFSPNTDRTQQSATRHKKAHADVMNDHDTDDRLFQLSFSNVKRNSIEASPLGANFSDFPPIFLCVGGDEILLDDSLRLARAVGLQGKDLTFKVYPDQFHMFWQWPDVLPAARAALEAAARFCSDRYITGKWEP